MAEVGFCKTHMALARWYNVSIATVRQWGQRWPDDFPKPGPHGWAHADVDAFLQRRQLGPWNPQKRVNRIAADASGGDDDQAARTIADARLELTEEKIRTERAEADKREIELSLLSKDLLLASDVLEQHRQIAATTITILDSLQDAIDRELPERCPTDETAWHEIRERLVVAAKRISRDCISQVRGLVESDAEVTA